MFTPEQYREKAAEYSELAKQANAPNEVREFQKHEQSFTMLADNEQWLADNHDNLAINLDKLTRLRLRPTSCMVVRGYCKCTPVEPAGTCPGYKSSKLDGSEDPWTTGARSERSTIGGGSLA